MRSVRGWHPARLAAMLMTYTGRRALAMEISKDLSMSLSRLFPFRWLSSKRPGRHRNALYAVADPPASGQGPTARGPSVPAWAAWGVLPVRFGLDFGASNTARAVSDRA